MSDYAIIVETGYKRTSANYQIELVGPMDQATAERRYAALRAGRDDDALTPDAGAVIVDVSASQFLRVRHSLGATVMDRVTLGPTAPGVAPADRL